MPHSIRRREFLLIAGAASTAVFAPRCEGASKLEGQLGLVSACMSHQLRGKAVGRNFTLMDLPRVMRDDLDLTVIDLNTSSFPSFAEVNDAYVDRFRAAADDAGCVISNLKMNQRGLDMNNVDAEVREKAIKEYYRSIDIAARLGCHWARPLPLPDKPDMKIHVDSYRRLCDYGAERNVQLLVENFGWMQGDPDSVVNLVRGIGGNVAAGPDTGNWNSNDVRYEGLAKTFPIAVTCDFKVKKFDSAGEHDLYDLRRCFQIGHDAGFRGPWCFEHLDRNTDQLFADLRKLRDMMLGWIKTASRS